MGDRVSAGGPPDAPPLPVDFGGHEDALRRFEERLSEIGRELERALEQRDRHAATVRETRQAVAELTQKAHAADGRDEAAASRYRAQRQRKYAAYTEAQQAFTHCAGRCERLVRERAQLERTIAKLSKLRIKARRRRLLARLRGVRDEDDTGASVNTHVPAPLLALGGGLLIVGALLAVGYQAHKDAVETDTSRGYLQDVLVFYGLKEPPPVVMLPEGLAGTRGRSQRGRRDEEPAPLPVRHPVPPQLATFPLGIPPPASRDLVRTQEGYQLTEALEYSYLFVDIDSRGFPELLFRDWAGQRLLIYDRMTLDGGYQFREAVETGHHFLDMKAGDLDHDGDVDLVTSCGTRALLLLMNDGAGNFTRVPIKSRYWPHYIALADINRDSHLDIVTTWNRTLVWVGKGDGTFRKGVVVDAKDGQQRLVVADFNDDGLLDVATVGKHHWGDEPTLADELRVTVLQTDGQSAAPTSSYIFDLPILRVVPFDFDGATGMDLVVLQLPSKSAPPWSDEVTVRLLWNTGTGRFDDIKCGTTNSGNGLLVRDIDSDGRMDVLAGSALFRNDGRELVGQRLRLATLYAGQMESPDIDGDGLPDVSVYLRGNRLALFRGHPPSASAF